MGSPSYSPKFCTARYTHRSDHGATTTKNRGAPRLGVSPRFTGEKRVNLPDSHGLQTHTHTHTHTHTTPNTWHTHTQTYGIMRKRQKCVPTKMNLWRSKYFSTGGGGGAPPPMVGIFLHFVYHTGICSPFKLNCIIGVGYNYVVAETNPLLPPPPFLF